MNIVLSHIILLISLLMMPIANSAEAESPLQQQPLPQQGQFPQRQLTQQQPQSMAVEQAPAAETKAIANPYGLQAIWREGDFVSRATIIILLTMSMVSWYVLLSKWWAQRHLFKLSALLLHSQGSLAERLGALDEPSERAGGADHNYRPFADLLQSATLAAEQVSNKQKLDADSWIAKSIDDAVDRFNSYLQSGMSILATVGSTAPFVGLFGTVWGIYHALTAIGMSGQASIDKVAGPVGEALIMTAVGLAVAVPAVLFYNALHRRNRRIIDLVRLHGNGLHAEMVLNVVH